MNQFRKVALIQNKAEWERVRQKTLGGDRFPLSWDGDYPVLVMELASQHTLQTYSSGQGREKTYLCIGAQDIQDMVGPCADDFRVFGVMSVLRVRKNMLGWVEQGKRRANRVFLIKKGTLIGRKWTPEVGVDEFIVINGSEVLTVKVNHEAVEVEDEGELY